MELIARFGIVDGSSCLRALHTLNACGYLISTVLRSTVKDCLKFYSVDKGFLKKAYLFHCNNLIYSKRLVCSILHKWLLTSFEICVCVISYISPACSRSGRLYPIICPKEFIVFIYECFQILTINELQNAVKWINDGILTGDSISSVVSRCCSSIIEQAVHLQCTNQLTEDCFLRFGKFTYLSNSTQNSIITLLSDNYTIRKHWINALNKFGGQVKRKCFAEIKNGDLNALTDNQLIEYLLTNSGDSIDCQKDNDAEENDGVISLFYNLCKQCYFRILVIRILVKTKKSVKKPRKILITCVTIFRLSWICLPNFEKSTRWPMLLNGQVINLLNWLTMDLRLTKCREILFESFTSSWRFTF